MANYATIPTFTRAIDTATFSAFPDAIDTIKIARDDYDTANFGAGISSTICCGDGNIVKLGGNAVVLCFFKFTDATAARVIVTA